MVDWTGWKPACRGRLIALIQSIYIKNFKAWGKGVFKLFGRSTMLVGENATGKTSLLEALDFFFNRSRMDPACIVDPTRDVEIGVRVNGQNFRKIFDARTHDAYLEESGADWSVIEAMRYVFVPAEGRMPGAVQASLREADADAAGERKTAGQEARGLEYRHAETVCGRGKTPSGDDARTAKVLSLLTGAERRNVVLGIDDIETSLLLDGDPEGLVKLIGAVGQAIVATKSQDMMLDDDAVLVYPVGEEPGPKIARMIGSTATPETVFLFVEGQYDLPWYKRGLELLGLTDRYKVLPGGGSNVDVLFSEFRKLGFRCALVRDGDMAEKADPSRGDFAIERDCIEMYAPDELLRACFGIVPPRTKNEFFPKIQRSVARNAGNTRAGKSRLSKDDVKSIIAERVAEYLRKDDPFVVELAGILEAVEASL